MQPTEVVFPPPVHRTAVQLEPVFFFYKVSCCCRGLPLCRTSIHTAVWVSWSPDRDHCLENGKGETQMAVGRREEEEKEKPEREI